MIFSELYGTYYNTVAKILKSAVDHPLQKNEINRIISEEAFAESILNIAPAIEEERWQLILKDGTTPLKNPPSMPLTTLQKRWLKAISLDPRIRLFSDNLPDFSDVEPLFTKDDYCVFDNYADGDPYEDENYIKNFRLILDAVRNKYPLMVNMINRKGSISHLALMPRYLEYSEKDDKFRLISSGCSYGETINHGRIVSCKPYDKPFNVSTFQLRGERTATVEFELINKRNALERVLLHFAHFEKEAEKIDGERFLVKITYNKDDETELVIRILSFGPMIKVVSPQSFVNLIKERLINQKRCER